jgi:hypothetical protein
MRSAVMLLSLALFAVASCDRDSGTAPTNVPAQPPPPKDSMVVEVQPITPLTPGRRTHVAPDGYGRLFWVQESQGGAAGSEVVFSMIDGGLPQPTKLTNAAVSEAIEQAAGIDNSKGKSPATGSIQSLTVGPDRRLYFYFSGGRGKVLLAGLGAFDPASGAVEILADAKRLEVVSGLAGLELARGSVVRSGDLVWLWLRNLDGYAMLSLETARASGPVLRRPFERVTSSTTESPDLRVDREDLVATAGDNGLMFWDRRERAARVWRIGPRGAASVVRLVPDLPVATPAPGVDDRERLVFLVPDAHDAAMAMAMATATALRPAGGPAVQYPALVLIGAADAPLVLSKDRFEAPARVRLADLTPDRIWRDRSTWVTYDTVTGEMLRLRVVER